MKELVWKITERKRRKNYALRMFNHWCLVCRDLAVQTSCLEGRLKESSYTHTMSTKTVDYHNNTKLFFPKLWQVISLAFCRYYSNPNLHFQHVNSHLTLIFAYIRILYLTEKSGNSIQSNRIKVFDLQLSQTSGAVLSFRQSLSVRGHRPHAFPIT